MVVVSLVGLLISYGGPHAMRQLPLTGVGGGNSNGISVLTMNFFVDTTANGTNGSLLTATVAGNDTHADGVNTCTWHTVTAGVVDAALTHFNSNNATWKQSFTTFGFNVSVNGTTYDGHDVSGAGLSWNVDNSVATSNFLRCILSANQSKMSIGFAFNTGMNGGSAGLHDFGAFITTNNGWQPSAQWSDKASHAQGCTNAQLGMELETSDSNGTNKGPCIILTANTTYWAELGSDFTGSGQSIVQVFNATCGSIGSSTRTNPAGVDTVHSFEIGDDPNGTSVAATTTLEWDVIVNLGSVKVPGTGC